MLTILQLIGRSPFSPLQAHMDKVATCIHLLRDLFRALQQNEESAIEKISREIIETEHAADLAKNDIRNHLPKSMFLAIDRAQFLEILSLQDHLADYCEDIAMLVSLKKPLWLPSILQEEFSPFLEKNLEAFDSTYAISKEMHELLESSFSGTEAKKVRSMVEKVALKENEADQLQQILLKKLFAIEDQLSYGSFLLWLKIFEVISDISNGSENLASRIRMTLELK